MNEEYLGEKFYFNQSPERVDEAKEPKKYKVILLNDDYTPMDFVVEVLMKWFYFDEVKAIQLMLQVHYEGRAVCGVFSKDVAETKVAVVNNYARANQHPLLSLIEEN